MNTAGVLQSEHHPRGDLPLSTLSEDCPKRPKNPRSLVWFRPKSPHSPNSRHFVSYLGSPSPRLPNCLTEPSSTATRSMTFNSDGASRLKTSGFGGIPGSSANGQRVAQSEQLDAEPPHRVFGVYGGTANPSRPTVRPLRSHEVGFDLVLPATKRHRRGLGRRK